VLARERAHLAYRHHLLATITRGLAAAFPGVPLFQRGTAEVARLTEMTADDAAARAGERRGVRLRADRDPHRPGPPPSLLTAFTG
jgi:hypothetical protein